MNEQDIFAVAHKLTGDERAAFVKAACGGDEPLLQQVVELLRVHDESGGIWPLQIDRIVNATQFLANHPQCGTLVNGRYKLVEAIGEGGMGTVWLAEQKDPVKRKVAIKLVKAGMDTRQVLA